MDNVDKHVCYFKRIIRLKLVIVTTTQVNTASRKLYQICNVSFNVAALETPDLNQKVGERFKFCSKANCRILNFHENFYFYMFEIGYKAWPVTEATLRFPKFVEHRYIQQLFFIFLFLMKFPISYNFLFSSFLVCPFLLLQ